MDFLYQFVKNIAFYSILSGIVIKLLPGKSYHKYMQLFIGLVLILLVLAPIGKLTKLDGSVAQKFEWFQLQISKQELDLGTDEFKEASQKKYLSEYEASLEEQLETSLTEQGYEVNKLSVHASAKEADFGTIQAVDLQVTAPKGKQETEDNTIKIDQVEAGQWNAKQDALEVKQLKELIGDFYQLDVNHINVEIRE